MRRKRLPPDTRPRWDDIDLPGPGGLDPKYISTICSLGLVFDPVPPWSQDTTYFWAERKKNDNNGRTP